eukprot:8036796-Pyramimonas_sp.AAC.1
MHVFGDLRAFKHSRFARPKSGRPCPRARVKTSLCPLRPRRRRPRRRPPRFSRHRPRQRPRPRPRPRPRHRML